ncbi:unnamed protein product [Adineta steineri]|uniref:Uncharacterized protein n=1 Tax=Adineta steineri TaxID=433720 RepID=A0A814KUB3_9BILA|nr:unnamed protein product [Adineta steineri]CAF3667177.1 unnamed protein product [Adineta steineri]
MRRREEKLNNTINTNHHMDQNIVIENENNNLNDEQELIQNYSSNYRHNLRIKNKRKPQDLSRDGVHMSQSFSQLSLSKRDAKKRNINNKKSAIG